MNTHLNVLHLERRTDRLVNLLNQLDSQGLEKHQYTLIEGIDDRINTKTAITKGHKHIVKLAQIIGQENCIIAEDDLCFTAPGAWNYFLSHIPEEYDLFCGLIYAGDFDDNFRILNGMSGTMTLYSVHQRFYEFFLSQPDTEHIDRGLGGYAHEKQYYITPETCVYQWGGYSDNLKRDMWYDRYLDGRKLFGR